MKSSITALLLLVSASATWGSPAVVEKAEAALREGFPQAAIAPLQDALRKAPASEKNALGLLLARAQLAAERPADALKTLDTECDRGSEEEALLRAAAFAAQGSLSDAAKLIEPFSEKNRAASLLLARILQEQGKQNDGSLVVTPPDGSLPGDPNTLRLLIDLQLTTGKFDDAAKTINAALQQKQLPQAELNVAAGRLRLGEARPSDAAEAFRQALTEDNLSAPVRDNARLGLARALIMLGIETRAREVLREAISTSPDSLAMPDMMSAWISMEKKAGADPSGSLRAWSTEKTGRRALEARLQLARLDIDQKRAEIAATSMNELLADTSLSPASVLRARLLFAEALIATGKANEAITMLDTIEPDSSGFASNYRLADLRGRAMAATGAYRKSYEAFAEAVKFSRSPEEKTAAATNCFLTALGADDLPLARDSFDQLRRTQPTNPELVRWSFLLSSAEARNGQLASLEDLSRRTPGSEYSFLAKLALAEWRLARGETTEARQILDATRTEADTKERAASLAAVEIFAADNSGSRSREDLIRDCREFLNKYPETPETVDVTFKLGELHSRNGDHAAAEAILVKLAQSISDPESAALAKFLAAQSASRSMSAEGSGRALAWFDEIAQGNTSIRHRARFEQASLLLRDRRYEDAITLYDRILSANPPREIRLAALMEKGDTLLTIAQEKPEKLAEATTIYASLANDAEASADWRDQAACKQASALARTGQTDAALAVYREILTRQPGAGADHFWFYKAGLEAARILEQQSDWPAAIAVYDQMASTEGPQRDDIMQRARRLRLEHFIWEN
jgi:tetratricopeptide (TPR) repeat protein